MTFNPTVKKLVTRPILKLENNKPLYVRILGAIFAGMAPAKRPGAQKDPAKPLFADVTLLDGTVDARLPIHPKLRATIDAAYPSESYVGKCFSITKQTREAGRQFTPFHVVEIEDPNGTAETGTTADPTPISSHASAAKRR